MNNNKGFSLIELMGVVAIVGILASLAIPAFGQMLERNRLKTVAQALQDNLQQARILAIKQSRNIIVTSTPGDAGAWCYGISDTGAACDCTQSTTTEVDYCNVKRILGSSFSNATNMSFVTADTIFDFRRGTANASDICVSTTHYKLKVMVDSGGRVLICSDTTAPMPGYQNCTANCP